MTTTEDWYTVRPVTDHSYAIWELERYAAYLVEGEDEALLIDTGVGVGDLEALVSGLTDLPVRLLITHSHWDHIGNAAQFSDVLAHPNECAPDGSLALDGISDDFRHRPAAALDGWRDEGISFPADFDPDGYRIAPVDSVEPVHAGDVIDLGGRRLELLALPGHSPGQLGALDRAAGVLYGADLVGRDYGLLAQFSTAEPSRYLASLRLAHDLFVADAFDTLVTGHMRPISGEDLTVLGNLADGLEQILAGDLDGTPVESRYGPALEFKFAGCSVLTRA
jgi:glyoxylase-like metal-dependent hydrolase (beta-lactamase superfamily II)